MRRFVLATIMMAVMVVGLAGCAPVARDGAGDVELDASVTAIPLRPLAACSGAFVAHDLDHVTTTTDGVIRMFEGNGAGLAAGDLDNDGDLDLVLGNLDAANTILWNDGDLRFRPTIFGEPDTRAITLVDVDADGWLDVVLTRKTGALNYWRNRWDGTFERRLLPGVSAPAYVINWGDLDGDGDLDLVVASYDAGILTDRGSEYLLAGGGGVTVYTNDEGRFRAERLATAAQALAILLFDYDSDGRLDLLVGNDFDLPDMAWRNTPDGWVTVEPFAHTTHSTMSLDAGDIHNDGQLELFASDMKPYGNDAATAMAYAPFMAGMPMDETMMHGPQLMENVLLVKDDSGRYFSVSRAASVDATGWSWTGRFGDLDQDGFIDLYVVNGFIEEGMVGHLPNHELVEENQAFRNDGRGRFVAAPEWRLASSHSGRSMIMADLDDDGDLDIVVNNVRAPAQLFENQLCSGHSLLVELSDPTAYNRGAIGAQAILHTNLGPLTRVVRAASGYLTGEPARVHFGLPADATIDRLEIIWPDGGVTAVPDPLMGHLLQISRIRR